MFSTASPKMYITNNVPLLYLPNVHLLTSGAERPSTPGGAQSDELVWIRSLELGLKYILLLNSSVEAYLCSVGSIRL